MQLGRKSRARAHFSNAFGPEAGRNVATMLLLFVPKMRQTLTFLATFENDDYGMKTPAKISTLALLTTSERTMPASDRGSADYAGGELNAPIALGF
jgi:hypothetical protein